MRNQTVNDLLNRVVAIDTETTGPDVFLNSLLCLALVPFRTDIKPLEIAIRWDAPQYWSGRGKEFFLGYKESYENTAVPIEVFCKNVSDYISKYFSDGLILVGHNVAFDYYFLKKVFHEAQTDFPSQVSHRTVDTHSLIFEKILKGEAPPELASSDEAFAKIKDKNFKRHTAIDDARMALALFNDLIKRST